MSVQIRPWGASATPTEALEESATNAEMSAEVMLVAAEAVLTETRETHEALTVSALQQAGEMSHRPETTAESFFQAHKEVTVKSKEQARQKQLDFLESMKVFEEVYEDELLAGTYVMSGRWVDTMKTPTLREVTKNLSVTKVALRLQQQYRASVCSWQGVSTNVIRDTKLLWQTTDKLFSTLKSAKANSCMHSHQKDGRRVVSPRRWQEHLSGKLKEHGFVQDKRDPCLFVNTELDICNGVHVDDMLAVGPSELTKNLLQELSKDLTMRWSMVIEKLQEFFGRYLCRTPQGCTFGVSCDNVTKLCKDFGVGELKGSNTLSFENLDDHDTILDESGRRRHSQLLGRLLWLDRLDIKNAVCQLSTHVATATTRERLLRYLIGNPACNMIVGCNLDVPGILRKVRSW